MKLFLVARCHSSDKQIVIPPQQSCRHPMGQERVEQKPNGTMPRTGSTMKTSQPTAFVFCDAVV